MKLGKCKCAKRKISLVVFFIVCCLYGSGQSLSLDYYLQYAAHYSPLLREYNNKTVSNTLDSLQQRAVYGFIVSAEGAANYAPAYAGWGYDKALTNGQSLFAGARVSKTLISNNQLSARLAAFELVKKQLQAQQILSTQMLSKAITEQYIASYTSQQLFKNASEINKILEQEDLVLKKLTRSSLFKQTDYLTFKVTLQQYELTRQQLQADWQNNIMLLNFSCGIVDTTLAFLEAPLFKNPVSNFENSVYQTAFVADSLQLANKASLINYDYKPKITAFSDAGFNSSLARQAYKNAGFSVGIAISLPLYDGHKKQMLLQQNNLELETRKNYLTQTKNQYQQKLLQLQQQIHTYKKLEALASEQMVYAHTLIEANAKQLPTGDVKILDFILSINNYLNLKVNSIQYQSTLYNLQNQLQNLIIQ